jgi:hypothetical protein
MIIKDMIVSKKASIILIAAIFVVGFAFLVTDFSSGVLAEEGGQEGTTGGGPMLTCVPPPPLTINAYKVICESESDLPNWGDGSGPSQIIETTATDYVAQHPSCELADGWDFQWGLNGEVSSPNGSDIGPGGAGWNNFDSSTGAGTPAEVQISDLEGTSRINQVEDMKPLHTSLWSQKLMVFSSVSFFAC